MTLSFRGHDIYLYGDGPRPEAGTTVQTRSPVNGKPMHFKVRHSAAFAGMDLTMREQVYDLSEKKHRDGEKTHWAAQVDLVEQSEHPA
jgi:hypothetical protein